MQISICYLGSRDDIEREVIGISNHNVFHVSEIPGSGKLTKASRRCTEMIMFLERATSS